jgi:hypothetical protein
MFTLIRHSLEVSAKQPYKNKSGRKDTLGTRTSPSPTYPSERQLSNSTQKQVLESPLFKRRRLWKNH